MIINNTAVGTRMTALPVAILYVNCTSVYNQTEHVGMRQFEHLIIIVYHLIQGVLQLSCWFVCGNVVIPMQLRK